jgi:hypothetical protein
MSNSIRQLSEAVVPPFVTMYLPCFHEPMSVRVNAAVNEAAAWATGVTVMRDSNTAITRMSVIDGVSLIMILLAWAGAGVSEVCSRR